MANNVSPYQWTVIILFFAVLLVWLISLPKKSEKGWTNNPWLPTMTAALLWGVWTDSKPY